MKSYNAEVYGYLFGSILSVTGEELRMTAVLAFLVVGLLVFFSKEFFFLAFDQEMAEASGVPARRFFFLLLTLIAITIVVSLKIDTRTPMITAYSIIRCRLEVSW